jgi:acyl-CoA thioester hydrolase
MKIIEFTKPIYTYEIDAGQHVSNIAYIKWMEVARLKLMEEVGLPIHVIKSSGFFPVLVKTEINYKKPLFICDTVRVVMWISEMKRISASMRFQFYNQHDDLVADGEQFGLFIKLDSQRPHKLSDDHRTRFEQYLRSV